MNTIHLEGIHSTTKQRILAPRKELLDSMPSYTEFPMISHDLIVYSGMIHSSPERNIPDWNESFQTGITYTDVVEKNPYWCYSEMLTFLSSGRESRSHSL